MQIWAESGKSAPPICNYSQILYQFLAFTQNLKRSPTYGQCAITASLVYDLFDGTIYKLKVDGGGTHYFNKINGHYIDLTSDQFDLYDIPLEYVPNEVVPREYCGMNADTNMRYQLLVRNSCMPSPAQPEVLDIFL